MPAATAMSRLLRKVRSLTASAEGVNHTTPVYKPTPKTPEGRELQNKVDAVSFWFHSIDLGDGVVTPGFKSADTHKQELASFHLPDLRGKSVLDIGAWDGFYSFTAERMGTARVVALDHHVWALDWEAKRRYRQDCKDRGVAAQPYYHVPELWRFDDLPGKRGFNLARNALGSKVEDVTGNFIEMDLKPLGKFDVVLYLGVLYHMEDPLSALRRLRSVTKEVAILETEAVEVPGFPSTPLCEFFPLEAKLADDPTNFWAPNAAALAGLCRTAGFRDVVILTKPPARNSGEINRYRLVAHALV